MVLQDGKQIEICIVESDAEKQRMIEESDHIFTRRLVGRPDYLAILEKICRNAFFVGAYADGAFAGFAAMYANDSASGTAYITKLGVLEQWQRYHIGSALLRECVRIAKAQKMQVIKLEVRKNNEKARRFYEKNGFIDTDSTEDSVFMCKTLLE